MEPTSNPVLLQLIRDGGLVVRADAPWWSRALASLHSSTRWQPANESQVHITVAEVDDQGEVGGFAGLVHASVEVCRYTGDRRYGHATIHATPEAAAADPLMALIEMGPDGPLGQPRASVAQ